MTATASDRTVGEDAERWARVAGGDLLAGGPEDPGGVLPDLLDPADPVLHADGSLPVEVWAPGVAGLLLSVWDDPDLVVTGREGERAVELEPVGNGWWRGAGSGVEPGARYGLRTRSGRREEPSGLLLDPAARAVDATGIAGGPCAVVPDPALDAGPGGFDWSGDVRPIRARDRLVVQELHLRGHTRLHPDVPEHQRGTYAGMAHPSVIGHLLDLGITAVELLPVHQFASEPRLLDLGLVNSWGYNTLAFNAPHDGYSSTGSRGGQVGEFKAMVAALHRAGIQVLLDVVYNHTAEQGPDGVTTSLRGLCDATAYRHTADGGYLDVTGCGNTLDLSHPSTLRLVLDSLRYWVGQMHVDGFRFDLAPALCRQPVARGNGFDPLAPFLAAVGQDPVLRGAVLVAEPWDIGEGGYVVGGFPAGWAEWNDRFRDTVRDFWRGSSTGPGAPVAEPERRSARRTSPGPERARTSDEPPVGIDHSAVLRDLASRLAGSSDLFGAPGRTALASVNFVTAHDGFTLTDLVSYDGKHNEANGEENRDGAGENRSANHGVEGPTRDPAVLTLRARQRRNLLASVLLAAGTPMILGGDELDRTQLGNNNAYCLDDPTTWVDWSSVGAGPDTDLTGWIRRLLDLRAEHACLRPTRFAPHGSAEATRWLNGEGTLMDGGCWFEPANQTLSMLRPGAGPDARAVLVVLHAATRHRGVRMPSTAVAGPGGWEVVADSAFPAAGPGPVVEPGAALAVTARSIVVLVQQPD